MRVSYGDVFIVDLSQTVGCEQGGIRPCIVIQNDVGNIYSTTTIIVPITSALHKKYTGPTHYFIKKSQENNLHIDGVVLCEQIRTIDKKRLYKKIGKVTKEDMEGIRICIRNSIPLI